MYLFSRYHYHYLVEPGWSPVAVAVADEVGWAEWLLAGALEP